jgi:membrane-bound lytic murein transglycosylase C
MSGTVGENSWSGDPAGDGITLEVEAGMGDPATSHREGWASIGQWSRRDPIRCLFVASCLMVGLLFVPGIGRAEAVAAESHESPEAPYTTETDDDPLASDPTERIEDQPVGVSGVLERQRRAYEAFKQRQSQGYESFQERRRAEYEAYMQRMQAQIERYRQIVGQAEEAEKDRIAQRWDDPELSSEKIWIEYDADLEERRRVDFEAGIVTIETLSTDEVGDSSEQTRAGLRKKLRALLVEDRATAFRRDAVAQTIEARSRREVELLETAEVTPRPILWPYLTGQDRVDEAQLELAVELLLSKAVIRETRTRSGEALQQATIPLEPDLLLAQLEKLQAARMDEPIPESDLRPSAGGTERAPEFVPLPAKEPAPAKPGQPPRTRSGAEPETRPSAPPPATPPSVRERLPARARAFEQPVRLYGERARLEPALVYAIIETESAFNPVARSPVPAYGLMQIVPQSAGQDATEVLFGRPRILAPSYLYEAENNIEIGTVYLELLMTRYLSGIRDPQSRLYCAIAAYNTGHGNVFKAFTGQMRSKAAFERINRMSSEQVYAHLLRHLPYAETRHYLPTVVARLSRYRGWTGGS